MTNYSTSANYLGPQKETNTLPSLTQPDMLMSLKEMLERYASGLPITGRNDGFYEDEYDFSDYDNMDFAERAEAMEHLRAEITHLESLNISAQTKSGQDVGAKAQQATPSAGQTPPETPPTDSNESVQ